MADFFTWSSVILVLYSTCPLLCGLNITPVSAYVQHPTVIKFPHCLDESVTDISSLFKASSMFEILYAF